jgi:hypothetical protein
MILDQINGGMMATISPDEKSTTVMVYTQNTLARGEVVTKQGVRVSTWLRTQGVPEYIHLLSPTVIHFGSGVIKTVKYSETYVPVSTIIAFHLAPPATDPPDYAEDEINRVMIPVTGLPGTFQFKGYLRVSSLGSLSTSIELAHSAWLSIYNVDVTNYSMPQMQPIHVQLILMNPKQISLAIES